MKGVITRLQFKKAFEICAIVAAINFFTSRVEILLSHFRGRWTKILGLCLTLKIGLKIAYTNSWRLLQETSPISI